MCGIWTRTRFGEPVQQTELIHPVQMLSHRGPDGYGWWADDKVALVHTRLSIIDLGGGAQPLLSHNERWIGIVNGELYDYDKVREDLRTKGVTFRTNSDSEVLLNLYALEGTAGLAKISGEFAFIFYDRERGEIHFGRDPMGVKPLFFEKTARSFTLASELKALSEGKPEISPEYVKTFIARAIVPPQTAIKNAEHVWPGRVYRLNVQDRSLTWKQYYSLPLFQERTLSKEDALAQLETELRASIERRLRADVEVGTYLSGGIDSALVAAIATDLGAKPKAFTVGFADPDFDESGVAGQIAADLGIEHNVVKLSTVNFMESLIKSIVAFENPITNPHGAAKNLLAAHAAEKVKVVLTGEGADEWFGGYAYLRFRKLQRFVERHPWAHKAVEQLYEQEMGMSQNHLDGSATEYQGLARQYFNGLSPALFGRLAKQRFFHHVTGEALTPQVHQFCETLQTHLKEEHPNYDFNEWDLNTWMALRTDLLHYILSNVGDRQEMAHSIEGRTPFMDPKVLAVAGRTPEKYLLKGLTEKYVLRHIGKKYLAPVHRNRGKRPFFAPIKLLYLRANRALVSDYIGVARAQMPFLDWNNIDHLLDTKKRSLNSPLEGSVVSLKLVLFSLGVLTEKLREVPSQPARGYQIPMSVADIAPFERKLCSSKFTDKKTDLFSSAFPG